MLNLVQLRNSCSSGFLEMPALRVEANGRHFVQFTERNILWDAAFDWVKDWHHHHDLRIDTRELYSSNCNGEWGLLQCRLLKDTSGLVLSVIFVLGSFFF